MDLKLLLYLWLLDLLLLHWQILLHWRVLHRGLHVLLHLGSRMWQWRWQRRVVVLGVTPTLQYRVILLHVEELPTISEEM